MVAIIPARSGSRGVIKKNVRKLGKHPLIAYSIIAAKLSSYIDEIVVSTDSEEIAEIAREYGAQTPFLRPADISQDHSTDVEFLLHYLSFNKENNLETPDIIVHLRPTTPLRNISVLDRGIKLILQNDASTGLRSVYPSPLSPYKVYWMEESFLKGFFPGDERKEYYNLPRQEFPQTYIPNGYVDVIKTSTLESGALHGDKTLGYVVDCVPDIDDEDDFHFAEKCLDDAKYTALTKELNVSHG